MESRLRIYAIRPGEMAAWLEEWGAQIAPLRRRLGFEVARAWVSEEADTFVWLLRHPGDYEAADRAYYESAERRAIEPDPARHIAEARELPVTPVPG